MAKSEILTLAEKIVWAEVTNQPVRKRVTLYQKLKEEAEWRQEELLNRLND